MEELNFIVELIVVIIDFLCASIMLKKTLKKEQEITKKYFTGATLFFFTHSACRTIFMFWSYYSKDIIFFNLGSFLGLLAVVFIVYSMETAILTKSKHFFTFYGLCCLCFLIIAMFIESEFLGLSLVLCAQYAGLVVLGAVIVLVYFSYIFKSTDMVRNHFILMFIAALLFCLGEMSNTSTALRMFPWLDLGAPLLILCSLILIFISITKYFKE